MAANQQELESMVVRILGDVSGYLKALKDAQEESNKAAAALKAAADKIEGFTGRVDAAAGSVRGFTGELLALVGLSSGLEAFKKSIEMAAEAESMEVSFAVMLQSAAKGKQMLADLQAFAASTPLTMPGLTQATKTLLQFGAQGDKVLGILKMLGDVTGGDEQKLQMIALAFGQMQSTGRLMGEELNQMINVGFNPLMEISRTSGKSMAVLRDEMEKGRITVDLVKGAFKSATSEGGNFFGFMEKQSQTAKGLFSTLQDDVGALMRTFGTDAMNAVGLPSILRGASTAAQSLTTALQGVHPQTKFLISLLAGLVTTILLVTAVAKSMSVAWAAAVAFFGGGAVVIKGVTAALWAKVTALYAATTATRVYTAATMGAKAAVAVLAAYVAAEVMFTMAGGAREMRRLNDELDRAKTISAGITSIGQRRDQKFFEQTDAEAPTKRLEIYQERLKQLEVEAAGTAQAIDKARQEMERNDTWFGTTQKPAGRENADQRQSDHYVAPRWIPFWGAGADAQFKAAESQTKSLNDRLEENRRLQERIRAEVEKNSKVGPTSDALKAVADLTRKYELEAVAVGKVGVEAEIAHLKLQKGVTDAMVANARGAAAMAEAAKKTQKLKEDVDALNKSLEHQVMTFGMSSEEAKIYDLQLRGATDSQLAAARSMLEMLRAQEKDKKGWEEAQRVVDDLKTPMEKFYDETAKLKKLFDDGFIDQKTYDKGYDKAYEDMMKVDKAAKDAKDSVQAFDAALSGGAEASRRIQAQIDMFGGERSNPNGAQKAADADVAVRRARSAAGVPTGRQPDVTATGSGGSNALVEKYLAEIAKNTKPADDAKNLKVAQLRGS